jgi:hypothetical protein
MVIMFSIEPSIVMDGHRAPFQMHKQGDVALTERCQWDHEITAYLKNGGTLENAAAMANHAADRVAHPPARGNDRGETSVVARIVPFAPTAQPANPASSVRGPSHVVKRGKTPVLSPE